MIKENEKLKQLSQENCIYSNMGFVTSEEALFHHYKPVYIDEVPNILLYYLADY